MDSRTGYQNYPNCIWNVKQPISCSPGRATPWPPRLRPPLAARAGRRPCPWGETWRRCPSCPPRRPPGRQSQARRAQGRRRRTPRTRARRCPSPPGVWQEENIFKTNILGKGFVCRNRAANHFAAQNVVCVKITIFSPGNYLNQTLRFFLKKKLSSWFDYDIGKGQL